ncbi:hypothetical protein Pyrfu_1636 [Pyrolobus fumarii 1A]|uniref:Uncharacterized protein n=1 Tax=Pyrolobus fumarii (strain DSM 11204 / 1A) TaxID=694429 RepID=G0ECC3_PYRF1|nr:hypothetical protein [Pyrolobus fumarii]AEM39493.1 hypothetical protein Pyrfu_1636 [Pyrolobus fumarii 1A]
MVLEEEYGEATLSEETSETLTTEGEEGEEGEAEEISVNVLLLEAMLDRLNVLEKLARGELSETEARTALEGIAVPESEKRRRRRRK